MSRADVDGHERRTLGVEEFFHAAAPQRVAPSLIRDLNPGSGALKLLGNDLPVGGPVCEPLAIG